MSRVYFHTKTDRVEVLGSERAYMKCIISDMTTGMLSGLHRGWGGDPEFFKFIPEDSYIRNTNHRALEESWKLYISVGEKDLIVGKEKIDPQTLCLNTALLAGNDQFKLMARIHGQCEIHGYIAPKNFAWLSKIISDGLDSKIFRQNAGWEQLIELLEKEKESHIVMSYTVCDCFPNSYIAGWTDENDGDDWDDLPDNEQWDLAFEQLLKNNESQMLEIRPEDWDGFHFHKNITAFDLLNYIEPD